VVAAPPVTIGLDSGGVYGLQQNAQQYALLIVVPRIFTP